MKGMKVAGVGLNFAAGVGTDLVDQTLVEGTAQHDSPGAVAAHALTYGAASPLVSATHFTVLGALADDVMAREGAKLGLARQLGLFSPCQLNSQPLMYMCTTIEEALAGYRKSACAGEEG